MLPCFLFDYDKFISFYHFIMACIVSQYKIKDFKCFAKKNNVWVELKMDGEEWRIENDGWRVGNGM